jgi:hypothetical protein
MTTALESPGIVSPFEDRLIKIARAIVGQSPIDTALPLVAERVPRPTALSPAAASLLSETLTSGAILHLARVGGWRRERFLRNGQPREGRIWERTPPADLALRFSPQSVDWLLWLTAQRPDDLQSPPALPLDRLTPADHLLLFLTYQALRDSEFTLHLRQVPALSANGLIRIGFPEDFTSATTGAQFETWVAGVGAAVLEAHERWLADRWVHVEQHKREIGDWAALAALGREQERLLQAFSAAADSAGRLDLVRFVLRAAQVILPADVSKDHFSGGLQGSGPAKLAERIDVLRMAVALPRHVLRLRDWERRARAIGYLDEGYAAAQLWLSDWERFTGDDLARRAEAVVSEVEPLNLNRQEGRT